MFRDRITSSPFLLVEITGDEDKSFTPKNGDRAFLKVEENNIEIQVILKNNDNENWEGEIISYHPEIKEKTSADRLDEINRNEKFINENDLSNGSEITFHEKKIHSLSR